MLLANNWDFNRCVTDRKKAVRRSWRVTTRSVIPADRVGQVGHLSGGRLAKIRTALRSLFLHLSPCKKIRQTRLPSSHTRPSRVVNSSLPVAQAREALARAVQGDIELLFLAPEQLRKPETLSKLKEAQPSLFVIDEAHCISE